MYVLFLAETKKIFLLACILLQPPNQIIVEVVSDPMINYWS